MAPKEVTVAAIEERLECWLSAQVCRDLSSWLAPLKKGVTWKNLPKASLMAEFSGLFSELAKVAPSGVLPSKKTTLAVLAVHRRKPANFTGQVDGAWADEASSLLRASFAKYREVASDAEAHRRCFSKARLRGSIFVAAH